MIQLFILHPCPFLGAAAFAANWDGPADIPLPRAYGCFHERSVLCSMYLLLSEEVTQETAHSVRESSIETKETTQIPSFVQQTTISLVSKRVEVVGPFGMSPKTGLRRVPASLFPLFLDRGNYSRRGKNGGPCHKSRVRLGSG